MTAAVELLSSIEITGHEASGIGNEQHPMRVMTRRIAGLAPGGWDDDARAEVASFFDELAPGWHTRGSAERSAVVHDALSRGLTKLGTSGTVAVEVGAGTGFYSADFAAHYATVLAADVAFEMSARAPVAPAHRVLADGGCLPLREQSVDGFLLVNAFLFPAEIDRTLRVGGHVLWVNSSGSQTPIYLSTDDIVDALPFPVRGIESAAGAGTWAVLERVS